MRVLLRVAFLGLVAVSLLLWIVRPADINGKAVIVYLQEGASLRMVTAILDHNSLITSPLAFFLLAKLSGAETKLRAGEYRLSPKMYLWEILQQMQTGKTIDRSVLIPEGYTAAQIASVLGKAEIVDKDAFLAAVYHKPLLMRLGIDADSAEGYLAPDTYLFKKGTDATDVATVMVNRFFQRFTEADKEAATKAGLTLKEVVVLASIIEKETANADERAIVSSIFHRRLKMGMPLQADPTVIYGLPDFNGNLTKEHLHSESPYNTYRIKGLPPGPIGNPGAAAIAAALHPAETDYLYFVSKNDGTHYFSVSLKEHTTAVKKYQRN